MNFHIKTITSVLLTGLFVFLAFASDENEKTEVKTNFYECSEIISYVKHRGYESLKKEWGEAHLGHISLDNNGEFQIDLVWNKVKVNGRIVEFTFTKGPYGPETFVMVNCEYTQANSYTNKATSENSDSTNNNYDDNSNETQTENSEGDSADSSEDENDMSNNIKSSDELEIADKKLNVIYKQVMAVLNETEKTELRNEQRKWIKYRDISCDEETKDSKGGSLYNAFLNNCHKEKTEKRIEELNDILEYKNNTQIR